MDTITLVMVGLAIVLLVFAFIRGKNVAVEGIKLAGASIWNNLALILAGFLIAGLMQVLLPKELIAKWLGDKEGFKAVLIGCVAGGLIPGSPYAVLPIVAGLSKAGAGSGAMVGFITAWSLWSVSRLPVEIALIEPKVALIRYAITFFVPPAAGLLALWLSKLV
jgi:uncharacterized membrane protein YraQ (UPF0718 family)